jgi:hypothetical protein
VPSVDLYLYPYRKMKMKMKIKKPFGISFFFSSPIMVQACISYHEVDIILTNNAILSQLMSHRLT